MDSFRIVQDKLEAFIRKYYLNRLLRGLILFLAVGLLYFLLTLGIEYFFWLSSKGRAILFWLFIFAEVILLIKLIIIPLVKLFKLSKGLNEVEASRIIGRHFPKVNDKLLNVLQLKKDKNQSDLLLAGIEQKAKQLQPVPFSAAINFRENLKYLKFAAFPVVIIAALLFTGNSSFFSDSYERVSHYNKVYQPPAPFNFIILNDSLVVKENEDFKLRVSTTGRIAPAQISLSYDGKVYVMKNEEPGIFGYTFKNPQENFSFYLESNQVNSGPYHVTVKKVPKLINFVMNLDYPAYTKKKDARISGTGNAQIPEGTIVHWLFQTRQTKNINFTSEDTVVKLSSAGGNFKYSLPVFSNMNYKVGTSNDEVSNYEQLSYQLKVKQDEYPKILVTQKIDTLEVGTRYFRGKVSDDYGLSRLKIIYYPEGSKEQAQQVPIAETGGLVDEFLFVFPGELNLERGVNYNFYFQVFDNDGINGAKSSNSEVFSYKKKTYEEIKEEHLEQQAESINQMNNSLKEINLNEIQLEELLKIQKENPELSYSQRKELEDFIKRQKRQNEIMQNYSEKLKNSLENPGEEKDSSSKELQRRVRANEEQLTKNETMLEELQRMTEKISREELGEKLEQMGRKSKTDKRNLEQLLELTKRYYVEEKKQKLARDLSRLSEKQEQLSGQENQSVQDQEKLTQEYEDFGEQMNELEKANEALKSPKDLGREKADEEDIKWDQQGAEQELKEGNAKKAEGKQKSAAEKMQGMSKRMQQQSAQQQGDQLNADIETLRQILDNLLNFSFEQEDLLKQFRNIEESNPIYANKLRKQNVLKEHFQHIDDSLYTLALSNQMINEEITQNLTNIEYDLDKALERLSENEIPQGTASQQYVVTRSNNLAYLLDRILETMQQMANPQMGDGAAGEEMQLMDIIQKQESLQEQMQEGIKKSQGRGENNKQSEEGLNGVLFEIYKEQQRLREELERIMEQEGAGKNGNPIQRKMEELEKELLDKKFNAQNLEKMLDLQHELMKFKDAKIEQGEDNKRISTTNIKAYSNKKEADISRAKEYFNTTEILNRQILPLRQIYKLKVKEYFDGAKD
ncbi:hypothetical protein [Zunongwangia sp. H14]|uniref:hypothetical protein n=1 Tax=Zunongwangia sp. H14 TaxID=3240792 RepID=UPI0035635D66